VIQDFLLELLNNVLSGAERDEIIERYVSSSMNLKERPGWEKGSPKRVNNLTQVRQKRRTPGSKPTCLAMYVQALNWNNMRRMNGRQLQHANGGWHENHCVQTQKQCAGLDVDWLSHR
jgi:hypothetical protein